MGLNTGGRILFILISGVTGRKSDLLIVMTFACGHVRAGPCPTLTIGCTETDVAGQTGMVIDRGQTMVIVLEGTIGCMIACDICVWFNCVG